MFLDLQEFLPGNINASINLGSEFVSGEIPTHLIEIKLC